MKQRWKHWCNRLIIEAWRASFFLLSSVLVQRIKQWRVSTSFALKAHRSTALGRRCCALVHNAHALLCNVRMRKCSLCSAACRVQHLVVRWRSSRLGDQMRKKTSSCHDQVHLAGKLVYRTSRFAHRKKKAVDCGIMLFFFFVAMNEMLYHTLAE